MLNPKYERTETAACAGCTAAQILVGFAPDMNYLTLACISNVWLKSFIFIILRCM